MERSYYSAEKFNGNPYELLRHAESCQYRPLTDGERECLRRSMGKGGWMPTKHVTLIRKDGELQVVDGWNRLRVAEEKGVPPEDVRCKILHDDADPITMAVRENVDRRHMFKSEMAATVAAALYREGGEFPSAAALRNMSGCSPKYARELHQLFAPDGDAGVDAIREECLRKVARGQISVADASRRINGSDPAANGRMKTRRSKVAELQAQVDRLQAQNRVLREREEAAVRLCNQILRAYGEFALVTDDGLTAN